jgi:hypothetical protein
MKIGYRAQGTGAYTTIGDDTTKAPIRDYKPRMAGIVQSTPLFRGANQFVAARGNRLWEVRFIVEDNQDTADLAMDSIQSLAEAIPDLVDLQIVEGGKTSYLTPAVFTAFEPGYAGRNTLFAFTFVGKNLTDTAP